MWVYRDLGSHVDQSKLNVERQILHVRRCHEGQRAPKVVVKMIQVHRIKHPWKPIAIVQIIRALKGGSGSDMGRSETESPGERTTWRRETVKLEL